MREKVYGLAIIGFGGMGKRHSELIKNVKDYNLLGVYDILEERHELARKEGIKTYGGLDDVLNDAEVDIVLVATPNHVHKDISIKALNAGKHVICEKPVTISSTDMEEIIDVAKAQKRLFVVHQNRRWDEDFLIIKKIYDENLIGNIFNIETRVFGSRGIPRDWRRERKYGGGMLMDWGVHLIDRLLYMTGEEISQIYCKLSYVMGHEVDDGFKLFMTFKSGKTALIEVGTWNFYALPFWYVCGEKGSAMIKNWDMEGSIVKLIKDEIHDAAPVKTAAGFSKTMAPRTDESLIFEELPRITSDVCDFYRNVLDAIEGKSEIIVKNHEVLRVLRVVEAAFESDRLNQVVSFE